MSELALWRARVRNCGCKSSTMLLKLKRIKLDGVKSVLHLSVLQEMLLIRAGDVELNPGPEIEGLQWISDSSDFFVDDLYKLDIVVTDMVDC